MVVVGDPAGMRALADRLAKDASQLRDAAGDVTKIVRGMDASGEWAEACRVIVEARAKQFGNAGARLDGLATTLRHSATEVEAAIEAERRRLEAAAQALEAARRAAALKAAAPKP